MNEYRNVPGQNNKYSLEIFLTLLIGPSDKKLSSKSKQKF